MHNFFEKKTLPTYSDVVRWGIKYEDPSNGPIPYYRDSEFPNITAYQTRVVVSNYINY